MNESFVLELERYLAGDMPPEQATPFLEAARKDPVALAALGKALKQQAFLFDNLHAPAPETRATRVTRRRTARAAVHRTTPPASTAGWWVGLAAAVLVCLIVWASAGPTREPQPEPRPEAKRTVAPEMPPPMPEVSPVPVPKAPPKPDDRRREEIEEEMRRAIPPPMPVDSPKKVEPSSTPPAPSPRPQTTVAAIARVEETGAEIRPGQGLKAPARRVVAFPDRTRLILESGTEIQEFSEASGKRVVLVKGTLTADVTPQTTPMVFATPQGDCTVLGTTLRILAAGGSTRLEVEKGKVLLKNIAGKNVEVVTGHYAVAAAGVELVARPSPKPEALVEFTFEEGTRPAGLDEFEGQVLRGPASRLCVAGAEDRDDKGNFSRTVRIGRNSGLAKFSEDLELRFDCWMSKQKSDPRVHMWNRTQNAALYLTLPPVPEKQWVPVSVRVSEIRDGNVRFRDGDVIGIVELVANVDPRGGEGYFDNIRLVRLRR